MLGTRVEQAEVRASGLVGDRGWALVDVHTVRPLDESTWPAFAALVERNNGIFGGCWCIGFHPEGAGKDRTTYEKLGFTRTRKIGKHRWVVTHLVNPVVTNLVNPKSAWLQVSPDFTQGELHVRSRGEAISAAGSACLDEKLGKLRADVRANSSWVDHGFANHGHRVRERVVAVAEELVQQHADGEQIGRDVPTSEAGIGWLVRRRA
jgi:hypothetical protein